jgi:FtsP/CotA-like multicopper oxidase with cupredoxin domain
LEVPVQRDYVMLAPGERIELWADFSTYALGSEIVLRSLSFSGGHSGLGGMMGGMMGGTGGALLSNGADLDVLRVRVETEAEVTQDLPPRLSTIVRYRAEDAVNGTSPRVFAASSAMMMGWLLNGRTFEMDAVAANELVTLNTLEIWELINTTGHMEMMHPLHIHGVQFQIVERTVLSSRAAGWETVRYGYVDEGWKDTLLLMPGERGKVLLRFTDFSGAYLYHCHNLEHEDQGMMRNYLVQA